MESKIIRRVAYRGCCCIFCCPPCPSKIIAKIAFRPPPVSTYTFYISDPENNRCKVKVREDAFCLLSEIQLSRFCPYLAITSRKNIIACIFYRFPTNTTRYTILYSHGNAVDLGILFTFLFVLASHLECNVFSYDFSGYGISTGTAKEKNLYSDVMAAWKTLTGKFEINENSVIAYGHSIGSVPTVYLASREVVAAVILHSPLASGLRFLFPEMEGKSKMDFFDNLGRISKVEAPVLIIHGKQDEIINIKQAETLYSHCNNAVPPLWIEEAGHNDLANHQIFFDRLRHFLKYELPNTVEKLSASE